MMEPPQVCRPKIWRLTCHGQAPFTAAVPPTIRELGPAELFPHSEDAGKRSSFYSSFVGQSSYMVGENDDWDCQSITGMTGRQTLPYTLHLD